MAAASQKATVRGKARKSAQTRQKVAGSRAPEKAPRRADVSRVDPGQQIWQLTLPARRAATEPCELRLFHKGADALAAFATSPPGSRLAPASYRVNGKSKALALKGESYMITISPTALKYIEQPCKEDDSLEVRFQKIGRAVDEFFK